MATILRSAWLPGALGMVLVITVIYSNSSYREIDSEHEPPSLSEEVHLRKSSTENVLAYQTLAQQSEADKTLAKQKRQSEEVLTDETFMLAQQDDPALIEYIRHQIAAPSTLPYNLTHPEMEDVSQSGQSSYLVKNILRGMRGGFFVEAGAVDGEYLSNTLYLERSLGWTGLLVEPYPVTYRKLLYKHRKAYSVNAALSFTTVSSNVFLSPAGDEGVLSILEDRGIQVKAFPLFSLLKALNVTTVDFLSLDVEGGEVKVLKTIPWDQVKCRVLCIEFNHVPEGHRELRRFVVSKGYKLLAYRKIDIWFGWPALLAQTMGGRI